MTQTKFTPGPWWPNYSEAGKSWNVLTLRDDQSPTLAGGDLGAYVCYNIGDHTENRTRDNQKANAHLIAAAPDLYAALEDAQQLVNAGECTLGRLARTQSKIAKALAKARGETQ